MMTRRNGARSHTREIRQSHRFASFADIRENNTVKWHIDGHDYFWAMSEILDSAQECIFILDWWLSPELYLRRPPADNYEWRLDRLLQRKAQQGVKVYVIVYKEVTQTMSMSSKHTKNALTELHPNITCVRHPDHIGSDSNVEFWSHHEKMRVLDAGYSLSPLADCHPTDFSKTLFPGQDYNNARVLDFQQVDHYASNQVSLLETARMPCMTDVDWLALPHDTDAEPDQPVARHPHRERWHEMGRRFKQKWQGEEYPDDEDGHSPFGTCRVQVVRSVSDWSHGVLTEDSVQRACMFASRAISRTRLTVIVVIPEVPGFAGNQKDENGIKTIMAAQYRTINRGDTVFTKRFVAQAMMHYIRFYHLRTYDRINSPASFIREMEQNSGVTFHQAQVAQARLWIGDDGFWHQEKVQIRAPEPTAGLDNSGMGLTEKGKETQKTVEAVDMPATTQEAEEIISRFQNGAPRGDEDVADTVGQHSLADQTKLTDEQWLGSEQEERDSYVSELLYIHSKVMIVDDRRVIMGSANINDRSQKGDGDSEIALVVEDTDEIESKMNGENHMATRFAASLRRKLFREHLGLIEPQVCENGNDPITSFMRPPRSPTMMSSELGRIAHQKNRAIFSELFRTVPNNIVQNWEDYKKYVPKVKTGHLATEWDLAMVKSKLSQIHGHLVEAPLEFLIGEKELVQNPDWQGLNPT
ncbi:phospholipase [Rhizoctonia solani]|uniref:phospholipase D n=1 Tax=Rhizoctonia solani TaxID=456999 RepID=A0A8H7M302_9AGAM|nr:phospholipase [Rhizoctonia solani]